MKSLRIVFILFYKNTNRTNRSATTLVQKVPQNIYFHPLLLIAYNLFALFLRSYFQSYSIPACNKISYSILLVWFIETAMKGNVLSTIKWCIQSKLYRFFRLVLFFWTTLTRTVYNSYEIDTGQRIYSKLFKNRVKTRPRLHIIDYFFQYSRFAQSCAVRVILWRFSWW